MTSATDERLPVEDRVRELLHGIVDAVLRERLPGLVENALNKRLGGFVANERTLDARIDMLEGYIRRNAQLPMSAEERHELLSGIGQVLRKRFGLLENRLDELEQKAQAPRRLTINHSDGTRSTVVER